MFVDGVTSLEVACALLLRRARRSGVSRLTRSHRSAMNPTYMYMFTAETHGGPLNTVQPSRNSSTEWHRRPNGTANQC